MQVRLSYYPQLKVDHFPDVWLACLQSYLQACFDHSGSGHTVDAYVCELALAFGGGKLPDTLSRADCEALIHRPLTRGPRRGSAPSISTINRRIAVLNSFFTYTAGYQHNGKPLFDKASPVAGVRYGKPTVAYKYMQESEVRQFFSVIDRSTPMGTRDYAIFLLFLTSARRSGELARLVWSDIEEAVFEDGRRGHIFRFTGKGRGMILDSQEISSEAYEALIHYLKLSNRLETMEADSPLFLGIGPVGRGPGHGGGLAIDPWKPMSELSISQAMKRYLAAANLPAKYSLHSWRHSSARFRVESGEDIRSVSKILRHQSLATTDRYISLLTTSADDFGNKLAQRFAVAIGEDGGNILPLRRRG